MAMPSAVPSDGVQCGYSCGGILLPSAPFSWVSACAGLLLDTDTGVCCGCSFCSCGCHLSNIFQSLSAFGQIKKREWHPDPLWILAPANGKAGVILAVGTWSPIIKKSQQTTALWQSGIADFKYKLNNVCDSEMLWKCLYRRCTKNNYMVIVPQYVVVVKK